MAARLSLHDVSLSFGGVRVLQDVSFDAAPGSILGLVGPNGAGKTSLFNCISGHYRPSSGSIRIDEEEVVGRASWRMSRIGLARTFQHPALQLHATVLENVMLGGHTHLRGGPVEWSLRLPPTGRDERVLRERALGMLERFDLGWAARRSPDELSHGLHKGVELCRALMVEPRLLLLDEPAAGLPHAEVDRLVAHVRAIRSELDVTIVIVEHNMGLISALTDHVVVLDHGRKLMEGTAAEAQSDPRVIEAYIGKEQSDDAA